MDDKPVLASAVTRSPAQRRMIALIIDMRASCQVLQKTIDDLVRSLAVLPAQQRTAEVRSILNHKLIHEIKQDVNNRLQDIDRVCADEVNQAEWCADEIRKIKLTWHGVLREIESILLADDFIDGKLQKVSDDLDYVIDRCVALTLSQRVNDVMQNLHVGQVLDIELSFGDEFPKSPVLRRQLLKELAQQSAVLISGVVDLDHELIYKSAATRQGQRASIWRLAGLLLLGAGLSILLADGKHLIPDWPLKWEYRQHYLVNYLLIFLGAGAHLAIAGLKAARAQTVPTFQAINDWVLWVSVREAQIIKGILYIYLGYILLIFSIQELSWTAAFFAGYSIDSVTELFLDRFSTTAAAKTKEITKGVSN